MWGIPGAGYAGKMLSMAAKKFGLKCKIFMGAKDIKRQRPNVEAMRKNNAEIGKGNKNVFSNHQIVLRSIFKNLVKWQQDFKILSNGNKILIIFSNSHKIFKKSC